MNIMCAFHHSRQTGILFERKGGTGHGVCVSWLTISFVQGDKNTKISEWGRSFSIEELGKFGKVVLMELVPRNAMVVRFEEGWR